MRKKGLAADAANFTISSFGGHPKVQGNGYVPYYLVFDHHGNLAHHHMGGGFHGGNGLTFAKQVDRLLAKVPTIDLGKAAFSHTEKLAAKLRKSQTTHRGVQELERRLAAETTPQERKELLRLRAAIVRHRDREIARATVLLGNDPTQVLPKLEALHARLRGSELGKAAKERLTFARGSQGLKDSIRIYRSMRATLRALDRGQGKGTLLARETRAARQLEQLIEGDAGQLPIANRVREAIRSLRQ